METIKASAQSTSLLSSLRETMRRHPLFFYFLVAYAFSWILTIPFILSEWGILRGNFLFAFILKSFGPFVAAYLMTYVTEGKEGVLRFRQMIKQTRAGWQWYLFILLGIPALMLLGIIVQPGKLEGFLGSQPPLIGQLPGDLCHRFLWGRAAWRGTRLARLCTAPFAASFWPVMGHPDPGSLVDLLAFAGFSNLSARGRARHRLGGFLHQLPYFTGLNYRSRHHLHLDLQSHPGKHLHRDPGARQRQYPPACFGPAVSCGGCYQPEPCGPHWLWRAGFADRHPDARPAWLPARPSIRALLLFQINDTRM